jgi:hypothetical protein
MEVGLSPALRGQIATVSFFVNSQHLLIFGSQFTNLFSRTLKQSEALFQDPFNVQVRRAQPGPRFVLSLLNLLLNPLNGVLDGL